MSNYFVIEKNQKATAFFKADNDTFRKLWNSFTYGEVGIDITPCEQFVFTLGKCNIPTVDERSEYSLCVTEQGAAVAGCDYGSLMRGIMCLLMRLEYDGEQFKIKPCVQSGEYSIKNRMIHICVFPENNLYFIKKLVRLSALCQYTHIVIEFWGMLKYDCMKELAWPNAFTKAQAKEIIDECNELGIKPIPMFNQLGHATASRVIYGKHVVLDQNPKLSHLFTPDGWAWNIHSDKVRALLKNIRAELYELFGECEYMHVGCDEAYYYTRCDEERKKLPEFIKYLTDEVVAEGKRPMVWMDMFLEHNKFNKKFKAYATCPPDEVEIMQGALNPKTVMVDWQYKMTDVPVETLVSLKDNIRDTIGAPWYDEANYRAHVETVKQYGLFGVMLTTWDTLKTHMPTILGCAKRCGVKTFLWSESSGLREESATMLRYVSFEGNSYSECGWSEKQIEV